MTPVVLKLLTAAAAAVVPLSSGTTDVLVPAPRVLPIEEDAGTACDARLGVVILSVDETLENEFKRYFPYNPGTVMYHARMMKGPDINIHDLNATKAHIPAVAGLLPKFPFDAVGFACTSDAAVLGEETISDLVAKGAEVPSASVTNPLTAAKRAFKALGAKKIALLTPYTADITEVLAGLFEKAGLSITSVTIFNQTSDAVVARISPGTVLRGIEAVSKADPSADAVFVSCTQTRTIKVITEAEAKIGKPVVASNSAMAWDILRLAGELTPARQKRLSAFGGRLFNAPVEGQGPRHNCTKSSESNEPVLV